MWTASQPTVGTAEIALSCASSISDGDLAARVRDSLSDLERNGARYVEVGRQDMLWAAANIDFPVARVTSDELRWLYTTKLVAHPAARGFYDRLLASALLGRCPYCNHNKPRTLDHFLPKSAFGNLSIEPWNLVPCCGDCNFFVRNHTPANRDDSFFHPYFTYVGDEWLSAELEMVGTIAAVRFAPIRASGWSDGLFQRVASVFDRLRLGDLYGSVAGGAMAELVQVAERLYEAGGAEAVSAHLQESAASCARLGPNQWRAVLYQALADSEWYCAGGFRQP